MENSLPKMTIETAVPLQIEKTLKTEWLVTNGLGGYASSTILGVNTRKYHGLLVAALNPPIDRHILLAKIDEEVHLGSRKFSLGTDETTCGMQPNNAVFPSRFSMSPLPTYTYHGGETFTLKKTVFMPHEKNALIIIYEAANRSRDNARILMSPSINCRDFHTVTQSAQFGWNITQKSSNQLLLARPSSGLPALALFSPDGRFNTKAGEWQEVLYRVEAERGESSVDNNFKLGFFEFQVAPNEIRKLSILATSGKDEEEAERAVWALYKNQGSPRALYDSELGRRRELLSSFHKLHSDLSIEDWLKWMVLAADAFIVKRAFTNTKSVIAGYHWFADWGRDSLISLPGLTLVLDRFEDARQILQTFNKYCHEGLVPNNFPDDPQRGPAYNTVDGTLWYFNAVLQYLKYTFDWKFVQQTLWPTLQSIIDHHLRGTLFAIHVDADGLLAHGPQLTWMDAASDGKPVTPREGKAVEIQALWYNALRIMNLLAHRFGESEKAETYTRLADNVQKSFLETFWNQQRNCLFDVVNGMSKDDSLRPNQILAASLDFTMLDKVKQELIVETVWKQLLTLLGPRTLSNSDPRYIGEYRGNRLQRDSAYHNGAVWPWLLGPFTTAFLKLRGYEVHWRSIAFENFLKPLFTTELYRAGLGSISEICDGNPPYGPNGCIAQAWSVAEPLRAYIEDVSLKRSPYEHKVLEPKTS